MFEGAEDPSVKITVACSKHENVMLHRNGYVKVLDFGLAKLTTIFEG